MVHAFQNLTGSVMGNERNRAKKGSGMGHKGRKGKRGGKRPGGGRPKGANPPVSAYACLLKHRAKLLKSPEKKKTKLEQDEERDLRLANRKPAEVPEPQGDGEDAAPAPGGMDEVLQGDGGDGEGFSDQEGGSQTEDGDGEDETEEEDRDEEVGVEVEDDDEPAGPSHEGAAAAAEVVPWPCWGVPTRQEDGSGPRTAAVVPHCITMSPPLRRKKLYGTMDHSTKL